MAYTDAEKKEVWNKCDGRCVYGQQKKVLLSDYSSTWEIDHANPAGVDDLRNRLVACIKHNRQKGDRTRQEFERWLEANPSEKACG
jgi:predicted Fe-S protein YdhL (DUF1289 family)